MSIFAEELGYRVARVLRVSITHLIPLSLVLSLFSFGALDNHLRGLRDVATTSADTKAKLGPTGAMKSGKDKKRKSKASQGVEKLKKANVDGMAKLSSYFKKA